MAEPSLPEQDSPSSANIPEWPDHADGGPLLSRRTLIIGGGAIAVGGLLTALNLSAQKQGLRGIASAGDALSLANFVNFSALVTGFAENELDPATAQAIYDGLQKNPPAQGITLEDLLHKAGYATYRPPTTLEAIEKRGVFDQEPYATFANGVIAAWYSGLLQTPSGPVTVAWLPALGWKALSYTMAPGYCQGATGIWGTDPRQPANGQPSTTSA